MTETEEKMTQENAQQDLRPIFLVSALVQSATEHGHRAGVGRFASKDEAVGHYLNLWQTATHSVVSFDATECTSLYATGAA